MAPSKNRPRLLAAIAAAAMSARSAACLTCTTSLADGNRRPHCWSDVSPATTRLSSSSSSSTPPPSQPSPAHPAANVNGGDELFNGSEGIFSATLTLQSYDQSQQEFVQGDGERGMGGGLSALRHCQSLDPVYRLSLRDAVKRLVHRAHAERARDSGEGRIKLGFCASNAPEALAGLKSWVSSLTLPRGHLHGMDVDGVPIPAEDLGSVYVKYSTGGAMTFTQMRKSGMGFDSLWRPGDALLEMYDGDFRGVYLNVELGDGVFRQFGVLPTDLFMEEEDDDW